MFKNASKVRFILLTAHKNPKQNLFSGWKYYLVGVVFYLPVNINVQMCQYCLRWTRHPDMLAAALSACVPSMRGHRLNSSSAMMAI